VGQIVLFFDSIFRQPVIKREQVSTC